MNLILISRALCSILLWLWLFFKCGLQCSHYSCRTFLKAPGTSRPSKISTFLLISSISIKEKGCKNKKSIFLLVMHTEKSQKVWVCIWLLTCCHSSPIAKKLLLWHLLALFDNSNLCIDFIRKKAGLWWSYLSRYKMHFLKFGSNEVKSILPSTVARSAHWCFLRSSSAMTI